MPAYSTPGVYVTETQLASLITPTVGGTAAVFFGEAARGPVAATLIQDWTTYKTLYGDLENAYDLGYAVYHYFANGGRACYVVRVVDTTATAAANAAVPFYPTGNANASATLFGVTASSPGTWGNSLAVAISAGNVATADGVYGTFNVIVSLGGTEVERWTEVTLDPNGSRYVEAVINNYSRYVTVGSVSTAAADVDLDWFTGSNALAGAVQGTIADSDYTAALTALDVISGTLILNAVGKTSSTIISAFGAKAQSRGDSFLIIDPSATDVDFADLQATAANYAALSGGGYAAHYVPMLKMVDPVKSGPGAVRTTYPGGAVAGLMVRTEVERTVAKAPAGYSSDIRGALGLAIPLTDTQIGTLYDGSPQVNCFKAIPGGGITVFGARTLSKTNPDKFISVRRTLNYIKYNVKDLTQFAVFEPNDRNLWERLNLAVSSFLSDLWRSGALKGERASDAFYVVCDESNNTAFTIDNGQVNIQIGVALQYPAEFVVIEISQWTGGSNTVESL
jgi:uncharacterized protein